MRRAEAVAIRQDNGAAQDLEAELSAFVATWAQNERAARIVCDLYGWDGSGPKTLEAVGQLHHLTRERVRQLKKKFVARLEGKTLVLPFLVRAIELIEASTPALESAIQDRLLEQKILRRRFSIDAILAAGAIIELGKDLAVGDFAGVRFVAKHDTFDIVPKVVNKGRANVRRFGCSTVAEVGSSVIGHAGNPINEDFLRILLNTQAGLRWLDPDRSWFWFEDNSRNRLINILRKVLAVAPKIRISEVRAAVQRVHRMEGFAPPRTVLREFCRQLPFCSVDGDFMIATAPLRPEQVLGAVEETFRRILSEQGPAMVRLELEAACRAAGINQHTFDIYLGYSPIIARLGREVYALVGADIAPGAIAALVSDTRRQKVLQDHGWTDGGEPWIGYKLSKANLGGSPFSIPAGFKGLIAGEYTLYTSDQALVGPIHVTTDRISGLLKFLSRRGGDEGDALIVRFNLLSKVAVAELGNAALLENPVENLVAGARDRTASDFANDASDGI